MIRLLVVAVHISDYSEIGLAPVFSQLGLEKSHSALGIDFGDDVEEGLAV